MQVVSVAIENRPNVVVVPVDDLDDLTTPYWDAMPQTKALLADEGLTFTHSFANDPVCCPARASVLTGDHPQNTGVFDLTPPDGGLPAFRDDLLIAFNGTYTPTYRLHTFADVETAIAAGTPMAVPTYRALRTADHLYVESYAGTVHEYAATTATLQVRLEALRVCSGDTCRN